MRKPGPPAAWLAAPLTVLLGGFFLAPLLLLLSQSLRLVVIGQPAPGGLTLQNYVRFLADPFYLGTLRATLVLGVFVTVLAVVLGYPVAYGLARARHRWRTLLRLCVVAPLLVSVVIRTYGWIVLLAGNGVVNQTLLALRLVDEPVKFMFTYTGVTLGLVHFALPVAILSLVSVIEAVDPALEEAARGLGAGAWRTFLRITLPLTLPGLAAGSMLVFSLTVAAFVTPALMGGPSLIVLSTLIYQTMTVTLEWGFGAAVATILLVVATGLFLLYQRLLGLARGSGHFA
ncbi:MAG TPA: ABC transporter permease [Methylomirabilota bacterium]|nr:ABC transporter permease [Methylomirabilota bacterium]